MTKTALSISILSLFALSACQSGNTDNVLQSAALEAKQPTISAEQISSPVIQEQALVRTPHNLAAPITSPIAQQPRQQTFDQTQIASLPNNSSIEPEYSQQAVTVPRTRKTYLINGLMSAVPFIGYGFRNLHKKMPEAQLHSYLSPVESAGVILPKVMSEIEAAYAKDPNVSINLIGISLGADFVSIVAEKLHKKNIPVNYLGIVDGTSLRPVNSNVAKVDNLTCTFLDCVKGKVRLAKGNTTTVFNKKKYKSSHIPLGNNADLHAHVIAQSRS